MNKNVNRELHKNTYKEIDVTNWNRYSQYKWFSSFSNPTYSLTKEMDVTNVVKYSKENNKSFFVCFLYLLVKGLNSVEEMRIRYANDKVLLYDGINPSYTVMTDRGIFQNVASNDYDDFSVFYNEAKANIEDAKKELKINEEYNSKNSYDKYYITCLPWIDFTSVTHPIPDNKESQAVPRICFSKFELKDNKYVMKLNINVNHAYVDGYPLSQAFIAIQNFIDNINYYLK